MERMIARIFATNNISFRQEVYSSEWPEITNVLGDDEKRFDFVVQKNGPSYLVWDFSCLTFLDSSGVGLILGRYNEIERINGKMGLVGLNSYSRKILGISGLFSLMREYRSIKEFISEERIYL